MAVRNILMYCKVCGIQWTKIGFSHLLRSFMFYCLQLIVAHHLIYYAAFFYNCYDKILIKDMGVLFDISYNIEPYR